MQNFLFLMIFITLFLQGCSSGSSDNEGDVSPSTVTQEERAQILETALPNLGDLSNTVILPAEPAEDEVKATVTGVDDNNNGVRDELEHIVYQGLNVVTDASSAEYDEVLQLVTMMQPQDPVVENSINEHEIYCSYTALSLTIKAELSLELLYDIVLDTQERKTRFNQSLRPSNYSLGAEVCE